MWAFSVGSCLNTLRLEKNGHLLQTTFGEVFSWMKMIVSWFIIHRSFFLWVQLKMTHYWFRWWLYVKQMAKHYVIQCWHIVACHMASPGHNGLTLWGLVKSYSNIHHLPLVQVMAWCLTWANAISVSVEPLGTNFNGIFIKIHWFSFMKLDLEMLSAKWPPFWWGLDVIMGGNVLLWKWVIIVYIDGLVKERRNSIANALELRLSCTNPSTCPCGGIHIQCGAVITRSIFSQIFTRHHMTRH